MPISKTFVEYFEGVNERIKKSVENINKLSSELDAEMKILRANLDQFKINASVVVNLSYSEIYEDKSVLLDKTALPEKREQNE